MGARSGQNNGLPHHKFALLPSLDLTPTRLHYKKAAGFKSKAMSFTTCSRGKDTAATSKEL